MPWRRPSRRSTEAPLQAPGVVFPADFARRLEALDLRLIGARERCEGAGSAAFLGVGEEFVGYRPYRPGEDLRRLDWNLLARLDRPFVRVMRREAAQHWAVLLDASASMGVGPPGKLQRAAEVVAGICRVGLSAGAEVLVLASDPDTARRTASLRVRTKRDLARLLSFLCALRAGGASGSRQLAEAARAHTQVGRLFLCGDLFDVEPEELSGLARRGRELVWIQILAPLEWDPARALPGGEAVEWVDPESGERRTTALGQPALEAYARALEGRLAAWHQSTARHGIAFHSWSSARSFEDIVRAAFRA